MNRQFFSFVSVACVCAALVACGSNVKLSDVPVEDRAGNSTGVMPGGTGTGVGEGSAAGRVVAPVQLAPTDSAASGPASAARVIYFDYDSFVIKPEFQTAVEAHARFLTANKTRKVMVEGHTDERGGREYNLALGQKRAEAVRRAMGLLGVGDNQVEAVSLGKEKPAATGASEEVFAKNRRAEFNYR